MDREIFHTNQSNHGYYALDHDGKYYIIRSKVGNLKDTGYNVKSFKAALYIWKRTLRLPGMITLSSINEKEKKELESLKEKFSFVFHSDLWLF